MDSPHALPVKPSRADYLLLGACCVLLVLFYMFLPLFRVGSLCSAFYVLTHAWNHETEYEHGWFIIPAVVFFIWRNRKDVRAQPEGSSRWGLVCVVFSLLLFAIGFRMGLWRLAIGALPILLWGAILYLQGTKRAGYFIFPLSLFYFSVPVPGLVQATDVLARFVTRVAGKMASVCGMGIDITGNKIFLLGKGDFNVNEGCSGIRSLMALLLIAFVYGYFVHREQWKRAFFFLAAVPLALVANILRIFSILVVADKISVDFAQKSYHDHVGFVSFIIALGLLMLLSRILDKGWKFRPRTIVKHSGPRPPSTPE